MNKKQCIIISGFIKTSNNPDAIPGRLEEIKNTNACSKYINYCCEECNACEILEILENPEDYQ